MECERGCAWGNSIVAYSGVLIPAANIDPMVVPDCCRLELFGSTPSGLELLELQKRLRTVCMTACRSTGCMVSFDYQRPYVEMMASEVLGQIFVEQAQRIGVAGTAPIFT